MKEAIANFFLETVGEELCVFFCSVLPIIELRGAIPMGAAFGLPWWQTYIIAVIGNMLPVPIILLFVKSVLTGAAVNVVLNAILIPSYGALGAVGATLAAELSVPVVQFIILRRELPYLRYLKYTLTYTVIGLVMVGAVRLAAMLPVGGWLGVGVQVAVGGVVYVALCLVWWKIIGNRHILGILKKTAKSGK